MIALQSLSAPLVLVLPLAAVQLGGAAPTAPQEGAGPERVLRLSLEDALRIAMESNLDLEIEEIATESASFDALGSWGSFDPLLTVTGTYSENQIQGQSSLSGGNIIEDNTVSVDSSLSLPLTTGGSFDLSLRHTNEETTNQFASFDVSTTDFLSVALNQPLLKGAWRRYATSLQRQSAVTLRVQRERERETRQRVLLDVYTAYWDLVSAREERAVRTIAVERGQQQLEQDQRRLEVGAGTEVDVLQSETNVAQQEELRIQAQFNLRQAEDTLRRMLFQQPKEEVGIEEFLEGWDWPIEPTTPLPTEIADIDLDWRLSLDQAVEYRPELWQRRHEIDAAELGVTRASSERQPTLDLNLSSSSTGFDNEPADAFDTAIGWDFPRYEGALTFSMPLLNRTASYALRTARATLRSARLRYDLSELEVLADVRAAVRDVAYRGESVSAATKSRDLAQRQLEAEESRQEVGLSTTFQVLQFQEDLASALSTEVSARAAYAKALAKLSHAEGRLDEVALGKGAAGAGAPPEPGSR